MKQIIININEDGSLQILTDFGGILSSSELVKASNELFAHVKEKVSRKGKKALIRPRFKPTDTEDTIIEQEVQETPTETVDSRGKLTLPTPTEEVIELPTVNVRVKKDTCNVTEMELKYINIYREKGAYMASFKLMQDSKIGDLDAALMVLKDYLAKYEREIGPVEMVPTNYTFKDDWFE